MIERFKDNKDGTIKTVNITNKGVIEMSLLFNKKEMDVVCVPTHYYCNLGCKMCHLTQDKISKPMIPLKKEKFLYSLVKSVTNNLGFRRTHNKKLLLSFMGVGEPLLNLDLIVDLIKSEKYIKERLGYEKIGYAISTMMPNDNILKLIEISNKYKTTIKVHFSLHNPIDSKRNILIPGTRVEVLKALKYLEEYKNNVNVDEDYIDFHSTKDLVEIHYTLIENVNDGKEELDELYELLNKFKITIKFIKFNKKEKLEISKNENIWLEKLKKIKGLRIKTYSPPGKNIGSSCGAFTKYYYLKEKEDLNSFLIWKNTYQIYD